jgi:hypothetical protein
MIKNFSNSVPTYTQVARIISNFIQRRLKSIKFYKVALTTIYLMMYKTKVSVCSDIRKNSQRKMSAMLILVVLWEAVKF